MRKSSAGNIPWYALAVLVAVVLKYHCSGADATQLKWILAPTARLVSLLTGANFVFVAAEGFVTYDPDIIVAPACAGVNFLVICFCMLVFSFTHRAVTPAAKAGGTAVAALSAVGATLIANAGRIVLCIRTIDMPKNGSLLSAERLHLLEGICVYFLALSVLYCAATCAADRILRSRGNAGKPLPGKMRAVPSLAPLFWYLMVMVAVPVLRGAYRTDLPAFIEYSAFVIVIPTMIAAAALGVKSLRQPRVCFGRQAKLSERS